LQRFDFIAPKYLGGRVGRTESARIARRDPHELQRDAMRSVNVARHILNLDKLVLRSDIRL